MRISPYIYKSSSSSSRWIARQTRDPYVKSRITGDSSTPLYRSRSSFKLLSMASKYPILSRSSTRTVVDLGAAPGGWSQVASHLLKGKTNSKIFALDILGMEPIPGVDIIKGDFLSDQVRKELSYQVGEGNEEEVEVDCVLSDMMAPMTGNRTRDVGLSLDLCAAATVFARDVLKTADGPERREGGKTVWPGGNLVIKFFAHPDMDEFRSLELDPWFGKVVVEKPKESRAESSEAYWVCLGFKGDPQLFQ
ncbi:ribosomal RNA large subunit methyltransferase J [Kwoniella shivajii]|uniref:rRNA methyltransferase 2, mitochondrial n=1 Tax=Kwoniella shivajii TaxID=564305 RepID=A0ABZ1D356_9TREE|nr:ribosomal RNA large subunit methyltransferase J [Kwoniella shivajii]